MKKTIVIGAGLSGLAAARALHRKGHEVLVLEGRDRVGGRCHTVGRLDLGAHWIHGTEGNPMTALARELSINTLFVGGDSAYTGGWDHLTLLGPAGNVLTPQEKQANLQLVDEIREKLDGLRRDRLARALPDLSIREALAMVAEGSALTPSERSLLDWHIMLFSRDDCAAGDGHLSLHHWDDGYEVYGYGDSVLPNGFAEITDRLASGLDIRLREEVTAIQYASCASAHPRVRVHTSTRVWDADDVVLTLPLGVLKAGVVRFDPPLPQRKLSAIQRLGFGNLTKTVLVFEEVFWPEGQYVFGYSPTNVAESPTTIINVWKTHRIPALVLLFGGPVSREMETWTDAKTLEWGLGVLRTVFGDRTPRPKELLRTSWARDPFARGSYSHLGVGSTPEDIEALAEPVAGCLYFAGEATHRGHWAAAHGAYVSGLRVAALLAKDPSLLPSRTSTENRRWREMMMRATRFFAELSATVSADELDSRLALLHESPVFSVVPPNELKVLATMFVREIFEGGAFICQAGEEATAAYLISTGEIEVRIEDQDVACLRRGEVVGDFAMFVGGRRTATLVARGRCELLRLDYSRFQRFLLACPESLLSLCKMTVHRLVEANRGGGKVQF